MVLYHGIMVRTPVVKSDLITIDYKFGKLRPDALLIN